MMVWALPLLPIALGGLLWLGGERATAPESPTRRVGLGSLAVAALLATIALAGWAALEQPTATLRWGGGLAPSLRVTPMVGVATVVVAVVATPVVAWAAAHERSRGLPRLLGLLVAFVGAMELLVLAADLLALSFAWELVGALSWALIGQRWTDRQVTHAAGYAFVTTRVGGLGLWVAAGTTLAVTGTLDFEALPQVARSPWGHAMAGGILLAAAAKSAQGPFAPWLFRAMEGPSSVSALLHSSTMVAAGAWLLVRLHEPLGLVPWLGPVTLGLGLATALGGGVVALVQPHAKRLLAASTSAQLGLVLVGVGTGFAGAGAAHLVTHAVAKALLFLAAGTAMHAAGSGQLHTMRLGQRLPIVALASAVGALALAAVPPLGAAWTKEQIVAATEHVAPWLALVTLVAGALGAAYAARFQRLAYGPRPSAGSSPRPRVGFVERASIVSLAVLAVALGVVWLPGLEPRIRAVLPAAPPEPGVGLLLASVASVGAAIVAVWIADRRSMLGPAGSPSRLRAIVADWLGLPAALRVLVITPALRLARACARLDHLAGRAVLHTASALARATSRLVGRGDASLASALAQAFARAARRLTDGVDPGLERAVALVARAALRLAARARRADDHGLDAAVCTLAAGIGVAGAASRRVQTGAIPTYYAIVASGTLVLALALLLALLLGS